MLKNLHIIAFTHKNFPIQDVGQFHIDGERQTTLLPELKNEFQLGEIFFLSTCNRVELYFTTNQLINNVLIESIFKVLYPTISDEKSKKFINKALVLHQTDVVKHLFEVATSIDSMVIGEREIITQIRNAYTHCKELKVSGDFMRILVKNAIATAKKVYTETNISSNPVSVVSLAHRALMQFDIKRDAKILVIGSGITNTTLCRFLIKQGYSKFTVFNRSLENAKILAEELKSNAFSLDKLETFKEDFDILLTCTAAEEHIITKEIYSKINLGNTNKKHIVDLANPTDIAPEVLEKFNIEYISIHSLQEISAKNLSMRKQEINIVAEIIEQAIIDFKLMHKERAVELAMQNIPNSIKSIKMQAVNEIFAKDVEQLDEKSKEILDKIISYMEKKYISIPMKMAKEIMLKNPLS